MENFQGLAVSQGRIGEDLAQLRLRSYGFRIEGVRVPWPGVEVDVIATNKHDISFYFTVKASWRGDRQGCKRTDTLKKAICDCLMIHLNVGSPGIIITSHKPVDGRGLDMVRMVPRHILLDIIELNNDGKRLKWLATADEEELDRFINQHKPPKLLLLG